jgi:assimilatory nitrate reductase catalytic subunit
MHLARRADGDMEVLGDSRFPVNQGGLCVKGWLAASTLRHPDRLRSPLARDDRGQLVPVSWDAAIARIANGITAVQHDSGVDAVGVFGGGSLTNEKAYMLGKFARVALRTANIDYNGRFCMSSAAAAAVSAFGIDRGLPFPLADIPHADLVLLVGSNVAETMPPIMRYFEGQLARGGTLVVVDPRRTPTAQWASHHLQLRPGTDAALANGLLHVLIRDRLVDSGYIRSRTEGFEDVVRVAAGYWPELVERVTGVPEALLVEVAHRLGRADRPMILTARGPEQQAHGVDNTLAYINVALAVGAVGKPFSGYGTLTGQGNGQGGREHGQKSDQLPGYRRIDDPQARRRVADVWQVSPDAIPGPGLSAYELLERIGTPRGIRALIVVGSNPAVSAPNGQIIDARLKALDLLVVSDFFVSETAALAHVVLPTAQWAEESGTTTNLEGRVIRRRRAIDPPDGVRTDLEILVSLAHALGRGAHFPSSRAEDVFDELRQATRGAPADYSGITYSRIDAEDGVFWPCADHSSPGVPCDGESRLFAGGFPTASGRAKFHAISHQPAIDDRDKTYPLFLTTGRILGHYQSGTQTHHVPELHEKASEPLAEIHPSTAVLLGLSDGGRVTLATRRGRATFTVKVSAAIREDTIFVPFHWGGEHSVNRLTSPGLDPTSRMPEFKVCAASASADETTPA